MLLVWRQSASSALLYTRPSRWPAILVLVADQSPSSTDIDSIPCCGILPCDCPTLRRSIKCHFLQKSHSTAAQSSLSSTAAEGGDTVDFSHSCPHKTASVPSVCLDRPRRMLEKVPPDRPGRPKMTRNDWIQKARLNWSRCRNQTHQSAPDKL